MISVSASHPASSLLWWLCHLRIHSLCSEVPVLQFTLCIFPMEAQNLISPFFSLGKYTRIFGCAECHMVVSSWIEVYHFDKVFLEKTAASTVLHDGCVTCAYSFSFGNKTKKGKASDSDPPPCSAHTNSISSCCQVWERVYPCLEPENTPSGHSIGWPWKKICLLRGDNGW